MKRALYIGGFCMPDGNAAAQRVFGIAKILRECGYDVRFAGLTRAQKIEPEYGGIDGFSYVNYPYPLSLLAWFRYLVGRDYAIKEIKGYHPDLVILYNYPAFAIEYIRSYCKKQNIKVLADITEWYEPQGNIVFKTIKQYDTNRRMLKSHKRLDGLICISKYLYDYYKDSAAVVLQLPPLVDLAQSKWQQPLEDASTTFKLVYAGSPGMTKDRLDLIINVLADTISKTCRNIQFNVIGITAEQYANLWGDKTHYPFVNFYGRIPHFEVIRHLLNADFQIFLRPKTLSNMAGFPTKFVESISSRTLPITNLSSNLSDYLVDGENGFVINSIEEQEINRALTEVLSKTPDEISRMRQTMQIDTFDYRKYIDVFSNFLRQL